MSELFNYQIEGSKWLSTKTFALLADEMGLGKSAQAITAADAVGARPVLVLCPAVARLNWMREWQKFSSRTLRCTPILSAAEVGTTHSSDVTICSYDLLKSKEVMSALSQWRWSLTLLDEAHYLKNRKAQRTKNAYHLAEHSDRAWALTGTPAPNDPSELWTMLKAFGVYNADYWSYMRRYVSYRETPWGIQITGGQRIPELRALMAPILLRRKKADVLKDLPPIMFTDVVVEPAPVGKEVWELNFPEIVESWPPEKRWAAFNEKIGEQQRLLETLAGDMRLSSDDAMKIIEGLQNKVTSLRRWTGLQKVKPVVDLVVAELEANAYSKIVVFAVHTDVVDGLCNGLQKFGAVRIYGATPARQRDSIVQRFQTDPACRVIVLNIQAGGIAINLTAAHQMLFVEADWTPANNAQAAGRCHRIGQAVPVTCRFVSMAGSIDEKITKVLRHKTRTLTELFDSQPMGAVA